MSHFDILAKFLEMYPQFHEQICQWKPNGLNTITVWFKNGQDFDFAYFDDTHWTLRPHTRRKYTYLSGSGAGRFMR